MKVPGTFRCEHQNCQLQLDNTTDCCITTGTMTAPATRYALDQRGTLKRWNEIKYKWKDHTMCRGKTGEKSECLGVSMKQVPWTHHQLWTGSHSCGFRCSSFSGWLSASGFGADDAILILVTQVIYIYRSLMELQQVCVCVFWGGGAYQTVHKKDPILSYKLLLWCISKLETPAS